jgi:hypothetical protein
MLALCSIHHHRGVTDNVSPASELASRLREHMAENPLAVTVKVEESETLDSYLDVTFGNGDGLTNWGAVLPESVCVLDPGDIEMTHGEFLAYTALRAGGGSAKEARSELWPRRSLWVKLRRLLGHKD